MADMNDGVTEVQNAEPATEPKAPEQDLEHWKSMSRKNERELKKALDAYKEVDAKLAEAEARIAELDAAAAYDAAVRKVAEETGIPEKVVRGLKGTTVEELTESTSLLKANYTAYPLTRDTGNTDHSAKPSTAQQFAAALEGFI